MRFREVGRASHYWNFCESPDHTFRANKCAVVSPSVAGCARFEDWRSMQLGHALDITSIFIVLSILTTVIIKYAKYNNCMPVCNCPVTPDDYLGLQG